MKKFLIFFLLIGMCWLQSAAQAFLIPLAGGRNDASQLSCDYYQVTPNLTFQQGAIWYRNQLNLAVAFDYTFQVYFGSNNGVGADGMAFVIQDQNQAEGPAGTLGSQLGYGSFPGKSIGVEFDTHNNAAGAPYGDIAQHHIAIDTSGVQYPPIAGPVPALASGNNIDDGAWHTVEIIWAPGTQTLTINFDGASRLTYSFTSGLAATLFGGQNLLYWGWTGASGSKYNTQSVRIPEQADFLSGANYTHCGLDSVVFNDVSTSGLNNLTYHWDFGDGTTSTQQNVSHNYTTPGVDSVKLTITDGGMCVSDTVIGVHVNSLPVITKSQTDISCHGAADGKARAIVTGGTPSYFYHWNPNVSTVDSALLLGPGSYGVTVIDHNGCFDTSSFVFTDPPALTETTTTVNELCYGDSAGVINITAGGGTPGYTYTWTNNVSTTSSATHLKAGIYNDTITDAHGCTLAHIDTITQPTQLTAGTTQTNVKCYGSATGAIAVTAANGTPGYTYAWAPNVSTTDSAENIAAGTYTITVADANGCSLTKTATVTQPAAPLLLTATADSVLCYGQPSGKIIVATTGGTPAYQVSVTNGATPVASATDTFSNLTPATYSVYVTDQNGCSDSTQAIIYSPTQLTDSVGALSPKCYHYHDGKVVVVAAGATPNYTYVFSNGVTNATGIDDNLPAGTYKVNVTDANGCSITDSAILTQPDSVLIDVTPTPIQVNLGDQLQLSSTTNQSGIVTYNWSPDFGLSCYDCSDPVFTGVYSQPYRVLATNQDSCFGTFAFTVTVVPVYNIFFPNAFTPNQDGTNDAWQVFGKINAIKQLQVSVFDKIGERVFESNDIAFKWDGTFKGQLVPPGVYTYMARVVWLDNHTDKLFDGSITLLR